MAEIKNDKELVASFTMPGFHETINLNLPIVAIQGARLLNAEQECRETYNKGNQVTEVLKQNLIKTFDCMNDTSHTLQEADIQAAKNSIGVGSWAEKIGIK